MRRASLNEASIFNWRMSGGNLLYSVVVLGKKVFLYVSLWVAGLTIVACDLVLYRCRVILRYDGIVIPEFSPFRDACNSSIR